MQKAEAQHDPARDPAASPPLQRGGRAPLAAGGFTHTSQVQRQPGIAAQLQASPALTDQRRFVDLIHSSPRHAAQRATVVPLHAGRGPSAAVAQLAAPTPVSEQQTGFNARYRDSDSNVEFAKLGGDLYLLNGRIIKWDDPNYRNLAGQVINLAAAAAVEEQDADVLDVGQGEFGYLADDQGPYKKIRSTNASPCVILTIHDATAKKTLMAHIHRKNRVSAILAEAQTKFGENNADVTVKLTTLKFSDRDNKDREAAELVEQNRIIDTVKQQIEHYLFMVEGDDVVVDKVHENAMIDSASGMVTNPQDRDVEASRGHMGMLRGMEIESTWGEDAEDGSKGFQSRTANVMDTDAAALQRQPVAQRKIFIGGQEKTAGELGDLGAPWNAKITDPIERQFVDGGEFTSYMANQTTHIGTVTKAPAKNVWVRFDPAKKYVLGESHGGIVLSDFTRAVKSQNFQHERFSRLDQIKAEGYERVAKRTEEMNADRYALYGVDMKTDQDINRYALESPMPKIAYCLNAIAMGLKPETNVVHGNGYSVIDRYTQYLQLSFTIVDDLMAHVDPGDQQAIDRTCLKAVLTDIKNGEIDFSMVKVAAENGLTKKIKKDEEQNLIRYCRTFVFDTLLQANKYADRTRDPASNLVKRKRQEGGDLTNPTDEPLGEALSDLRDEEMINHLRPDVQYVGMGDAHARRLQPRLEARGFQVVHVPKVDFSARTKTL